MGSFESNLLTCLTPLGSRTKSIAILGRRLKRRRGTVGLILTESRILELRHSAGHQQHLDRWILPYGATPQGPSIDRDSNFLTFASFRSFSPQVSVTAVFAAVAVLNLMGMHGPK